MQAYDGSVYILRHDEAAGEWELTLFRRQSSVYITIAFGAFQRPHGVTAGHILPMLTERLFGSKSDHADPARRVTAVATLPPESDELAALLGTDPAPEVRIAAANRCTNPAILALICGSVRSWRVSSRPEGSPTFVVPPPISTMGR